jgi:hypothetical protein
LFLNTISILTIKRLYLQNVTFPPLKKSHIQFQGKVNCNFTDIPVAVACSSLMEEQSVCSREYAAFSSLRPPSAPLPNARYLEMTITSLSAIQTLCCSRWWHIKEFSLLRLYDGSRSSDLWIWVMGCKSNW